MIVVAVGRIRILEVIVDILGRIAGLYFSVLETSEIIWGKPRVSRGSAIGYVPWDPSGV